MWQSYIPQLRAHGYAWPGGSLDLTIAASIAVIDGVGGVLGSASASTYYPNVVFSDTPTVLNAVPASGSMTFDTADVGVMEAQGTFGTQFASSTLPLFRPYWSSNLPECASSVSDFPATKRK